MARIRTIKPDFFRHIALFEAEKETGLPIRVAFAGLWTAADREGRFVWSPQALKLDCLPYDDVDFARVLDALWTRGHIERYAVGGKEFGFIPSWGDHQVINNRELASKLPEPNENNILTRAARVDDASMTREGNFQGEGKGKEGKGKEGKGKEGEEDWRAVRAAEDGNFLAGNGAVLVGEPMPHELPVHGPIAVPEMVATKRYAFSGEVIRLTPEQFARWQEAYPKVDLRSELQARDDWLCEQDAESRKRWFHSTSSFLAGRERRAKDDERKKRELEASIYRGVL